MIGVTQSSFYDPLEETRGDCVAACVATIFELPLEEVDIRGGASFQDVCDWTKAFKPHLRYNERDLCTNHRIVSEDPETIWAFDLPDPSEAIDPPTDGLWIAHVVSPRGLLKHGPYRGMPIEHAVVMCGPEMVWDPHPDRHQGVGRMTGMGWWTRTCK